MPSNRSAKVRAFRLIPLQVPIPFEGVEIRAIGRQICIATIRLDTDVQLARVQGGIGVGPEAVKRVGACGAAVQRVQGEGPGVVGRQVTSLRVPLLDPLGAADGEVAIAVHRNVGCLAAF